MSATINKCQVPYLETLGTYPIAGKHETVRYWNVILYSGKFLQGRNFRDFRDQTPAHENFFPQKIFPTKISCWRQVEEAEHIVVEQRIP